MDTTTIALPRREYRPGIELSVIGFGGILVRDESPDTAERRVAEAIGRGVNYFDVAPQYGDAEIMLGPALERHRDGVFLACKTECRDAHGAAADLERSLRRLRTDHFDLYQLHHITDVASDVEAVFAKGGAMETLDAAQRDGRVRHVGFSAHSVDAAFAAMDRYPFDSILVPVSLTTWVAGDFGPQIVARAREKGLAILALKALAKQKWPANHPDRGKYPKGWYEPWTTSRETELALRFTLSQPVTAAIPPGDWGLFLRALEIAERFTPLDDAEAAEANAMAEELDPIFAFGK